MNELYLARMKEMLGAEYDDYFNALSQKPRRGIRLNPLKTDLRTLPYLKTVQSPFVKNGLILEEDVKGLGSTLEYVSGVYYIQEPGAASAVSILAPEPGMKVLDLCAAPGSKSTQIAECLKNEGLLVCNEVKRDRASILLENIERHGAANVIVISHDVSEVANEFEGFFDQVLCDAPCSGEGMFRKESEDDIDWSLEHVKYCAKRQKEILESAYRCLRPGGTMVYSTCTFSKEENEDNVADFLMKHNDMKLLPCDVQFGRSGFASAFHTELTRRIYPMDGGEGHFIAKFKKEGSSHVKHAILESERMPQCVKEVFNDLLERPYPYYLIRHDRVYGGTSPFYDVHRLHLLRNQVFLGEIRNNRFEPSHHFFMSSWTDFKKKCLLSEDEAYRYLHGEEIAHPFEKGFTAVTAHGYVIGGAKSDGKKLKNRYPKRYRIR